MHPERTDHSQSTLTSVILLIIKRCPQQSHNVMTIMHDNLLCHWILRGKFASCSLIVNALSKAFLMSWRIKRSCTFLFQHYNNYYLPVLILLHHKHCPHQNQSCKYKNLGILIVTITQKHSHQAIHYISCNKEKHYLKYSKLGTWWNTPLDSYNFYA